MYHLLHCVQPILLHKSFGTPWHVFFYRWTLMTHSFVRSRANSCTSFLGSMHRMSWVPFYLLMLRAIICFFCTHFFLCIFCYDLECFSFLVFLLYPKSYDGAFYFPFCLSCALYFYFTFFAIFVRKMGRSIKRMWSQSNTKGKGDLGYISRQKMEIFIF